MGVKQSADAAQEIMESVSRDPDKTNVCIDDAGTGLRKVSTISQSANFAIDPLKCEWAVQETDWVGHWVAPTGLKPWRKTVDAVLSMHLSLRLCFIVTCFPDDHII
jgi:hypothetical protein